MPPGVFVTWWHLQACTLGRFGQFRRGRKCPKLPTTTQDTPLPPVIIPCSGLRILLPRRQLAVGSTAKPLTRPRPLAPSAPSDRLYFGGRSRLSSVPLCERSRVAFAWRHAGAPLRFAVRSSRSALRTRGKTHHLRAGWSWCSGRGRLGLRRGTPAQGSMARPTACALLTPLRLRCSYSYYGGRRGRGFGTYPVAPSPPPISGVCSGLRWWGHTSAPPAPISVAPSRRLCRLPLA